MVNFYEVTTSPTFFYRKYFLFYIPKKKFEFKSYNFSILLNKPVTQFKSIVLNFFSTRFQIVSFLPRGFYIFGGSQVYSIAYNFYFASLLFFLFNFILGFSKSFKSKLYLIGLRVKIEKIYKKSLILKLNLCHKVKWKCSQSKFLKFKKIKNSFLFKTKDFFLHNSFLFIIRRFKLPDFYKGNGIRFYKEKLKLKKRKQFGAF